MKIKQVTDEAIIFDNGSKITFAHNAECCERNYADFSQIEEDAFNWDFSENNMRFEVVPGAGFRFGSKKKKKYLTPMFFIPCYSEQNGYYSSKIEIYYNSERYLIAECEDIDKY